MFSQSLPRLLKPLVSSRSLTNATAKLRTSSSSPPQDVLIAICKAPEYLVIVPSRIGSELSGRKLGEPNTEVDLVFHGGCHYALDSNPDSPRLTIPPEVAGLIDDHSRGVETPATLFHDGNLKGSAIALKGTEGELFCQYTAQGAKAFSKALRDLE